MDFPPKPLLSRTQRLTPPDPNLHTKCAGLEIYGPALNRAYHLESREAKYPRVLIGDGLIEFLDSVSKAHFKDQMVKASCLLMVDNCKSFIVRDDDGRSMIHFLGSAVMELSKNIAERPKFYKEYLIPVDTFISECEEKYKEDIKLGPRYQQLRTYFDKYINEWRN